jgi:hypothetical protein
MEHILGYLLVWHDPEGHVAIFPAQKHLLEIF